jgi:hypothetical protein
MKKSALRYGLGIALTTVLFSASCRKDNIPQNKPAASRHQYKPGTTARAAALTLFEPNNMSWAERCIGYDVADEGFRKAKLFYSLALREIVKDPSIAAWICDKAKQAENNVIFLDDVFAEFPGTRELAAAVTDPLQEMNGWSLEQVTAKMQYDNYHIKPAIYLMNAAKADSSIKPLVSTGDDLDLDDEVRGDQVLAWHLDQNNTSTAITIWESLAEQLDAPVLCIDGLATNLEALENAPATTAPDGSELPTGRTSRVVPITDHPNMRVTLTRYRIAYRYDAAAKSEIHVAARCMMRTNPDAPSNLGMWDKRKFLRQDCLNPEPIEDYLVVKLHKRDINSTRSIDRYFAKAHSPWPLNLFYGEYDHYMVTTPSGPRLMNRKSMIFNLYERDGFVSAKKLISFRTQPIPATGPRPSPYTISGKMSKYNEWYLFNPNDDFHAYAINLPYPAIGWTHDEYHGKADMQLKINNHCTY